MDPPPPDKKPNDGGKSKGLSEAPPASPGPFGDAKPGWQTPVVTFLPERLPEPEVPAPVAQTPEPAAKEIVTEAPAAQAPAAEEIVTEAPAALPSTLVEEAAPVSVETPNTDATLPTVNGARWFGYGKRRHTGASPVAPAAPAMDETASPEGQPERIQTEPTPVEESAEQPGDVEAEPESTAPAVSAASEAAKEPPILADAEPPADVQPERCAEVAPASFCRTAPWARIRLGPAAAALYWQARMRAVLHTVCEVEGPSVGVVVEGPDRLLVSLTAPAGVPTDPIIQAICELPDLGTCQVVFQVQIQPAPGE